MRIWLDPNKLATYALMPSDVVTALKSPECTDLGGAAWRPAYRSRQQINATVTAMGRLSTPDQFANITLRSNTDGSTLHLRDVARVELGATTYATEVYSNGKVSSGIGIALASGANALKTSAAVTTCCIVPSRPSPGACIYGVAYQTTPFVRKSIHEVIKTLVEAIVLVFLVMWLFLQNLRATLIPTIAVPVVLLGTFAILKLAAFPSTCSPVRRRAGDRTAGR